ncbi:hypothetical protein [Pseudoduganella umbonata]|uniref:Uncharacterized protein n=1 Tax=Pseudoduganella umbonata TaxID=864828 RepID=A0A4P8HKN2_9BURK|nr:hypothetical protein [Pseudoduganella umbonata]MBB3221005.1 hypothetical protein [Pseudoduganella umbonata]QCP10213.1 hypothetical protein FCL38_07080 [Pseudoduganella umbonata]
MLAMSCAGIVPVRAASIAVAVAGIEAAPVLAVAMAGQARASAAGIGPGIVPPGTAHPVPGRRPGHFRKAVVTIDDSFLSPSRYHVEYTAASATSARPGAGTTRGDPAAPAIPFLAQFNHP